MDPSGSCRCAPLQTHRAAGWLTADFLLLLQEAEGTKLQASGQEAATETRGWPIVPVVADLQTRPTGAGRLVASPTDGSRRQMRRNWDRQRGARMDQA